MNRLLKSSGDVLLCENELVAEVHFDQILIWICEITLLIENLTERVIILSGAKKFGIQLGIPNSDKSKCLVMRDNNNSIVFILPKNQCEYLQATLLKAYRDGAADVNHLHLDGILNDRQFDLTVMFDRTKPPLSPEQMKEILDRED